MSHPDDPTVVDVAVGVIIRPDGQVLLGQRPPGKPYAGWWEFPGGKVEAGENVHQALARELLEELGLEVHDSAPWLVREHAYEHAYVRLHFRRVTRFEGEPQSREGQAFTWSHPNEASVEPLLPATVPLMRLLSLPDTYGISCASLIGVDAFVEQLGLVLPQRSILLQLREPDMPDIQFADLFSRTLDLCRRHGSPLLVNSCHPVAYWDRADGVHLRSADIDQCPGTMTGSDGAGQANRLNWIAASCHNASELSRAAALGVDFVTLSPVRKTLSHPLAKPLGWEQFESLALRARLPVYALGGLHQADLAKANAAGAHGIAMIRGLFES